MGLIPDMAQDFKLSQSQNMVIVSGYTVRDITTQCMISQGASSVHHCGRE
jgi:hypothetical protein